ncbi:MAG: host attachment protein [Myxococcales bacterium]|nr:host attachment protein [Myxococcales bacterium]
MKYCVVCADLGRARLFVLDTGSSQQHDTLAHLDERAGVVNPARRLQDARIFSDSRPGLRRVLGSGARARLGARHGVDDRRDAHRADEDRRYAADVCERTAAICDEIGCNALIIAAAPRMLGLLREGFSRAMLDGLDVRELRKDITFRSPIELHDYLADADLLPPRGRLKRAAPANR